MWQKYVKIRSKNQVISQTRYPRLKIAREVMVMFPESFVLMHCLKHIECPQKLDKNWQTWNYQLRTYPLNGKPNSILSHVNLFPFTVTQRQDWQGTGSGQRVRRPSDRLPFALQQSERKVLPTTVLSPTTGLSSPIIPTSTFIPREPRPITRIRSTTQQ